MPQGSRLSKLALHLRKIANVAVRNVATWAGNLMLTHNHADFPSDVFTIMQAAGASLNIIDNSATHNVSLPDFLQLDMAGKIITSIVIPFDEPNEHFLTFKIMPRHVNAHAYVNAGFRLVSTSKGSTVVGNKVLIMYGGIGPYTIQAAKTAKYLVGKDLSSQETLNGVMAVLSSEISPDSHLPAASPQYRKSLALSLFYKFYLSVLGSSASSRVLSASSSIVSHRPVSSGIQKYSTDPSKYPLTQPMTKMAAKLQTSGKAEYVNDIPIYPNEARGAFVKSTQANAKLVSMDASTALAMPGVIAFLQAKDIPSGGINNWRVLKYESGSAVPEMLFTDDYIGFAGQSVGLIVADTQAHADMAARAVRVTQSPLSAPILTIQDAIAANSLFPDILAPLISGEGDPMDALKASKHVISGEISCGYQYHFHMETQRCLTVPTDSGLDVYSSTQWMDYCQESVAQVLGVKKNSVNVSVKRLGGGFGGKILNSHLIAAATSLAASKLNRPVRVVLDLDTNMQLVGGRPAWLAQYQVGCDDSGKLNCVVITLYMDCGITNDGFLGDQFIDNAYYSPHWKVSLHGCKTHTPTSTACRAPGSTPNVFIIESVMEHVAKSLGKTPEDVRVINLYQKGQVTPYKQPLTYCNISSLWSQLMDSCEFTKRQEQVEAFNKANRWKKRGLSVIPLKFGIGWTGAPFSCVLSVYAGDASVMITTGGIEMGQGLTTKIVQVTAFTLGIDVDLIRTRPSNVLTAPNNSTTGGSIGSELSCAVAVSACKQLLVQMKPARDQLSADATWLQVVTKCFELGIDLQAKAWIDMTSSTVFNYNSYGVTCTEVELDVLTGENQILRTDILYDCGESMNPEIDVGQAEGAFVFGLGFFLTEHFIRDPSSGQLLTKNTWEYKPCTALDIPIDFRVTFLKDAPNPLGILRSKAVGEPPLCMSCSALFAIKHAVENARAEIQQDTFFPRSGPATVDAVQSDCLVNVDQFTV
ncbi:xanthine dehydrogenase/oxidase-like [Corticium candelabrum]|uniref:xanthine dehydrogenase/oxidase-like n=1 Tax=Corticium candelabrum TaxID=121492 RepID=UPI002E2641EF|nr:xanthine dehydrogenase/oxidase-like [Corticium candelabrum]